MALTFRGSLHSQKRNGTLSRSPEKSSPSLACLFHFSPPLLPRKSTVRKCFFHRCITPLHGRPTSFASLPLEPPTQRQVAFRSFSVFYPRSSRGLSLSLSLSSHPLFSPFFFLCFPSFRSASFPTALPLKREIVCENSRLGFSPSHSNFFPWIKNLRDTFVNEELKKNTEPFRRMWREGRGRKEDLVLNSFYWSAAARMFLLCICSKDRGSVINFWIDEVTLGGSFFFRNYLIHIYFFNF